MNPLAIAVVVLALAGSDTGALVEASKESKAKRKGSTTKVITNADVAKADKNKVAQRKGVEVKIKPQPTLAEKHATDRQARLELEEKLKALDETIVRLETELAALEQQYYEENDLNYRDTELVTRFNETKTKLDEARVQHAALSSSTAQ